MTHPIVSLQSALVTALKADAGLTGVGVFDAPVRGAVAPYLVIARHDLLPRDGDLAPGFEHRVAVYCWAADPSRKAALALAERVVAVADGLTASGVRVTHRVHERTDTAIDLETGQARAAVGLRFFSEPNG
jgi:hypothetical protein